METSTIAIFSFSVASCLNRTMQYGNYFEKMKLTIREQFKSYYVVWKRNHKDNYSLSENTFKSYYVVWKQKHKTTQENKKKGLNRTMQYGNEIVSVMCIMSCPGLNRTMQYGN